MSDPYKILGVSKTATPAEIKAAWRKLAKQYHPDVNAGREDIEKKFKAASAAYDLLSDPKKRASFDRGEIDGEGNPRSFRGDNPFARDPFTRNAGRAGHGAGAGGFSGTSGNPFGGLGADFFADFFARGEASPQSGGRDVLYDLVIPFTEACLGGTRRLKLASGKVIDVRIPPATEQGHKLRLKGMGEEGGTRGGAAGDAIVTLQIEPHVLFTREGHTITLDVPISVKEAILGETIRVPTLHGSVDIRIPQGASSGTTLRLRGKGVPYAGHADKKGDMLVRVQVMIPNPVPQSLTEVVKSLNDSQCPNPRTRVGWK